jgi:tetratricopeptide (TPR) repeat protein
VPRYVCLRSHSLSPSNVRGNFGDGRFPVASIQPMIRRTTYTLRMKRLQLLLAGVLCLVAPCVSSAAEAGNACLPDKTFARVGSLLEKKDYQGAKTLLRGLESCPHLLPLQRFNVGWLYGKAHDSSDALKIFKSVPTDVPDRLTHGYAIALANFELGQYQAAIDKLTVLSSGGLFDAKCADLLGVSYSKLSRYQEAYDVMVENLRQNPANPYAYFNLITLFVDTRELDKAAQVADKAVAALPQDAEALSMRGSIELSQGKTEDAYRDFALAAQLSPGMQDPPFFMALADYRQMKFEEAAKVLRTAIASGIVDSDLHYLLAESTLRIDPSNLTTALAELDQAIQLNPDSVSARALRGSTLLDAGRPQEALVDLKIAQTLDPNSQRDTRNTTYLLGRAYIALGKRDEAKALFAQLGPQFSSNKTDTLNQLSEEKVRAALHP